jgi:LuxR family transcriptional regulator, maltose regulon positive regulatory protein
VAERKDTAALGLRYPRFPSSKFAAPKTLSPPVHRSRLVDRLDRGAGRQLTVVVASPGAGKTVLLADWLTSRPQRRAAWVNCDVADAEPVRLIAAVIETVRRASGHRDVGEEALQLLSVDGQVSADAVAALAEDLERTDPIDVLVIDDFHHTGVHGAEALAQLMEYRPPSLQLVVATRVDPPLRLHRMRTNQDLVELRDRDLAFSAEETTEFLSGFGLNLGDDEVALVHQRSEGWVAGLQMAALSIQGSPDPVGAAGRVELHRHTVAGYFLDEVLERQPREVADFMLATSVLDELSVDACTALCGESAGSLLDLMYKSHMFVAVVDEEAGTFRYHHLIREVLRAELHTRDPARQQVLHATAATHLAEAGQVGPAARQLLAAGRPEAAFGLLSERALRDFSAHPSMRSVFDLDDIQPDGFAGAPEILVPLAIELLVRGAFERGSRAFELAQQASVHPDRQPDLAVQLALLRAFYCMIVGELGESLAHRDRVRHSTVRAKGIDDWLLAIDVCAAYCHTYLGQFPKARQLVSAVSANETTPTAAVEVLCPGILSQVALAEGALDDAGTLAAGALEAAERLGFQNHYFAFASMRTAARIALERRDMDTASELTERALGMLGGGRPLFAFLAQLDRARIWAAAGNLDEALASLPAARSALRSERSVMLTQADEIEARLRLALGDRRKAEMALARLPPDRRAVVSTIVALAAGNPSRAAEALAEAPQQPATIRFDLEIRLLHATIAIAQTSPHAGRLTKEALVLVDRHGFVQTVLDTTPQLVDYLISDQSSYARTDKVEALIAARLETRKFGTAGRRPNLPDPLTDAEIRVLEKLPQRLTYADMASELHLSLNTVKTHLRHTYMKLGVNSRTSAVRRASSLGLI